MTTKELETIVARHEMPQLELKESFGAEAIESACAFANAHGGFIVIGIDNNGHLAKKPLRGESLRDYENRIATEVAKNESEVTKKITKTKAKVAENASAAEGARTESESAQTVAENAKTGAESAQTVAESAKTEVKIEALIDSFFTNPIRSDARRNMIAILDCLMRHPDNSATMVAKKLGLSQNATQKIMGTLRRAGLLRREGPDFGGCWVVNGLKEESKQVTG